MSCIYKRGNALWIAYSDATGKRVCKSSGFKIGQEAQAREFLSELEKQLGASLATRAATNTLVDAPATRSPGPSVRVYGDAWLKRRENRIATVGNEEGHLRNHVYPRIGDMAMRDVKPRYIRDLVLEITESTVSRRGDDGAPIISKIAPRTVLRVFQTLHRMFKSAVVDEVVDTNPVIVEKGILPKNIDKDPEWRATAVFDREELVTLISDTRIPRVRRVLNALKGLAALRHGEAAGLRWNHYRSAISPLGKLLIARSYDNERTKTKITREVPVHPVLAQLLAEWRATGWAAMFGRAPADDDLIVPNHKLEVWPAYDADEPFKDDLAAVGLRSRRGHDLRRTFITLAQVDGARRDLLKVVTHGAAAADIMNLYTTFPWPTLCAEVAKLSIELPGPGAVPLRPQLALVRDSDEEIASKERSSATIACSATGSATRSAEFPLSSQQLASFEPLSNVLRNRCSTTEL